MKSTVKSFFVFTFIAIVFIQGCLVPKDRLSELSSLKTEYLDKPLGIESQQPRFSWQMTVPNGRRGYYQTAYQIIVLNPDGALMWNSEKIEDDKSLNIKYAGRPLEPATRYDWTVTIWDQNGKTSQESSWFETGLMNSDSSLSAWEGATWIGGGDDDLVFYSPYFPVFKLQYKCTLDEATKTTKAGFIFGANDSRLLDRNKNILGIESRKNETYIKFELDISALNESTNGLAHFNIYRAGYHPDDKPDKALVSIEIPRNLINDKNKYQAHSVYFESVFGLVTICIDGMEEDHRITIDEKADLNLNPVGSGHRSICFPMIAEIGFNLDPGQKAIFSELEIRNFRSPSNLLFSERLDDQASYKGIFSEYVNGRSNGLTIGGNAYRVEGGDTGSFIIGNPSRNSMPMLRTEFKSEDKKILSARLYVTARGVYEVYINGERVGSDYFNPGLTQYNKTHMYQTYDVTKMINSGKNAIGAILGEGWWSGNITYSGECWNFFGDRQSLLAMLVINYKNGTTQTITTNPESWFYYNKGPVVYSSFFQGEVYDASRESSVTGWSEPGYNISNWKRAARIPLEGTTCIDETFDKRIGMAPHSDFQNLQLIGQIGENAGIVGEISALAVDEVRPGVFVYDMGQNMVGIPRITLNGIQPNRRITLRYAEVKYPDLPRYGENIGMIMLENIRAALSQDIYITKGGNETILPRFTFHGYRFLEITGIEKPLPIEAVKGEVISSIKEFTAGYETSNERVNRLWKNINWSARSNFLSIPTDCPQRNERMGWSGDISVFARTSTYLTDASLFFRRHMKNMRDTQREDGRFTDVAPLGGGFGGILWGSAGITVAWESYQQYGDKTMLEEHYDAMKKYISFLNTKIDKTEGVINEGPLGDWLSPEGNKNDNTLIWESYYLYNLDLMVKIADALGKTEDTAQFLLKYNERKKFFNTTYFNPESGKTIKSGFITVRRPAVGENAEIKGSQEKGQLIDTQTSYAVPLALGSFNSQNESIAAASLANTVRRKNNDDNDVLLPEYSLMTGFIGTAWISKALSDHGNNEIAYRLLQQTSYPSWLYSVDQGATTIWERLNSYTVEKGFGQNNGMNSFNHYAFGAVGAWMINYSLGIKRADKDLAFKKFILQPTPDPDKKMTYARGYYNSLYGIIESEWHLDGKNFLYSATVPPNTSATLYLPCLSEKSVEESGKDIFEAEGVTFLKYENGKAAFKLKSGKYSFVSQIKPD